MIEEIDISNFRAFSKPVKIRLRPITILIGKNSAGKSTLMKFLLMLRQTLESQDGAFLVTEGQHVKLGALRSLQNRNPGYDVKRLRFEIRMRTLNAPSVAMLQLLDQLATLETGLNLANEHAGNGAERLPESTRYDIRAEMMYSQPDVGRHLVTANQADNELFVFRSNSLRNVRLLSFPSNTSRPEGELEAMARNTILRPVRQVLVESRHLSPVREDFQTERDRSSLPLDDVGHHGEFAYQHLYEILNREGDKADFVTESIRGIAKIDDLEFKARAREFQSHFRGRNMDTGARCHLKDFGFGVGQCIPIFVQGALLQKGQLLMVEQPEAQLHPTAQLELGSYFADLWRRFGVPSLVETHSDNLFLRMRKLVTKKVLVPDDVSIAYFSVENRAVTVKNIDIMEDGHIGEGLPMEFFGADLLEVLEMH